MRQAVESSPSGLVSVIKIIGGGALLTTVVVGGSAMIFSLNQQPPAPAAVPTASATTKPGVVEIASATGKPVETTVASATKPVKPKPTGGDPIRKGWDLLLTGQFDEAKLVFQPLTIGQKPNPQALHGFALASYNADKDRAPALEAIDQAVELTPKDAAVVYNAAVMHLTDSPLKSAKLLRDYMADSTRALNEDMQNLLGLAISRAGAKRTEPQWMTIQGFYADYDKRLEAGRTQKRWGQQWLDPDVVDSKWARINAAYSAVDTATRAQRDAIAEGNRERLAAMDAMTDLANDKGVADAKARVQEARDAEKRAQDNLRKAEDALNQTERPPFPQKVEPIVPKAMGTPAGE